MDIVGANGYVGQDVFFLDGERFAFVSGRSITVHDVTKGPRDMVWKTDNGINQIAVNAEAQLIGIAAAVSGCDVEIIGSLDYSRKYLLQNPSSETLIDLKFSRSGERIFALSGVNNHKILVWDVKNLVPIVDEALDSVYSKFEVNPCNPNQICLYGDKTFAVGTISEVMGQYSFSVEKITFDEDTIINFVLWLPLNHILIGTSDGQIFKLSVKDHQPVYIGTFLFHEKRATSSVIQESKIYAVCAVLGVAHIIIGTDSGRVMWYPTMNLMETSPNLPIIDFSNPQQMSILGDKPIRTLSVDTSYTNFLAGSLDGALTKLIVQPAEDTNNYDDPAKNDDNGEYDSTQTNFKNVEAVDGISLGVGVDKGIVLCSKFIALEVQKFSARGKSTVSVFATGSHYGVVNFWRQSGGVVEPLVTGGGIRRSTPRALAPMFSIAAADAYAATCDCAIVSLEFFNLPEKRATLCCIGYFNGSVECWLIEALEHEEEERDDGNFNARKVIEDDEGGCIVKIETKKVFECKIMQSPVSLMLGVSSLLESDKMVSLIVGSDRDHRLYVINILRNDHIILDSISLVKTVDVGESPKALTHWDNILTVFCESGASFVFDTTSPHQSGTKCETGLEGVLCAVQSGDSSARPVILVSNHTGLRSFPVTALPAATTPQALSDSVGFRRLDVADVVVCVAAAPSGRYFATGSIDGTLSIFKGIDTEDSAVILANKLSLHNGAITSVAFSSDSSLLMTSGADGSCFVVTLDKPFSKKGPMGKSFLFSETDTRGSFHDVNIKTNISHSELTWSELKEQERIKELKTQEKFRTMGISAAVGEISQRLKQLVNENAERNELEIMDRSEFVIDTKRMDELLKSNVASANEVRVLYEQCCAWNEALAARVRAKCWDSMEVNSGTILPFFNPDVKRKMSVSSFSVQKYTTEQEDTLRKIKILRGMEIKCQRSRECGDVHRIPGKNFYRFGWNTSFKGCPQNVSWIANDGLRWPIYDSLEALLANEKTSGGDKDKAGGPPGTPGAANTLDEDDDASLASMDDEREIDENNILNLLYAPESVRTQVQKRNQIVLLRDITRSIRQKFNDKWKQLYREKEDIVAAVESRNVRIAAILADLHSSEVITFAPTLANVEIANSSISVAEEELTTQKYESEAARAKRLKEEEERRLRELEKEGEDVKGRALEEMMHGTLEVKRDVFAEASALVKPEWMDVLSVGEMNEHQLKEYDAYQQKLKALQEEQNNYRKALEQEMKKLKGEIADTCKAFDEKLDEMARLKVLVSREILSHELYIARLGFNTAKIEHNWKLLKQSEEQLQSLRKDRSEIRNKIEKFNLQLDEMKHKCAIIEEDGRQMDKSFKRDLQNLCNNIFDQDKLKIFTQLYRMRSYPRSAYGVSAVENFGEQSEIDASASVSQKNRRSGSRGPGKHNSSKSRKGASALGSSMAEGGKSTRNAGANKLKASKNVSGAAGGGAGSLGPMQQAAAALRSSEEVEAKPSSKDKDPYYATLVLEEKKKKMQESLIPQMIPLSMESDCPEGFDVDQFYWSKLQELRNQRIEKEIEFKVLSFEIAEFKQKLEIVELEEALLTRSMTEVRALGETALRALSSLDSDLDIIVCLRQGQDEVDRDAVVTDYSNSLLLPVEVVSKFNSRIRELGKEKIGVLSKIKQFRRKINLIDWEAHHYGLEARHYEQYLTDLQLFRVTRELQKVIRDDKDGVDNSKEKLDKAALRKDFLSKNSDNKLANLKKTLENFKHQFDERAAECANLEDKITRLKVQVAQSKSVKQSRDDSRGGVGDSLGLATAKMKKVVARRRLVDTARTQAEEIDFLRQELDRMRQRTFPSFIRATKKRLGEDN